jgi:hypothetical protein
MNIMKNASVFIDYEYLFWSLYKHHARVPNMKFLMNEIRTNYKVVQAIAFGDFTKNNINQERDKLRVVGIDIIDCATEREERNYADFFMLDSIYRTLIDKDDVEVFILFTGDGHFSSVVAGLVNYRNKEVGILGVPGTISRQLKESASWVKEVLPSEADIAHGDLIKKIIAGLIKAEKRSIYPSFSKTVEFATSKYNQEQQYITTVLSHMINQGLISQELRKANSGNDYKALSCNIDKIKEMGLLPD